jgi:hypothetical protein
MNRLLMRSLMIFLAVLVFCSVLTAATLPSADSGMIAQGPGVGAGWQITLPCILMGAAMVFLVRPKRRPAPATA